MLKAVLKAVWAVLGAVAIALLIGLFTEADMFNAPGWRWIAHPIVSHALMFALGASFGVLGAERWRYRYVDVQFQRDPAEVEIARVGLEARQTAREIYSLEIGMLMTPSCANRIETTFNSLHSLGIETPAPPVAERDRWRIAEFLVTIATEMETAGVAAAKAKAREILR